MYLRTVRVAHRKVEICILSPQPLQDTSCIAHLIGSFHPCAQHRNKAPPPASALLQPAGAHLDNPVGCGLPIPAVLPPTMDLHRPITDWAGLALNLDLGLFCQ